MPKGSGLVVSVSDGKEHGDGLIRSGKWEGRRAELTSCTSQTDSELMTGQMNSLHRINPATLKSVLAAYESRFSSEAWRERLRAYGRQEDAPLKADEMDSVYAGVLDKAGREKLGRSVDRWWSAEECEPTAMPQVQYVNRHLRAVQDPELHGFGDSYDMLMPEAGVLYHCLAEDPYSINIVVHPDRHFDDPEYEDRSVYVKLMAIDGYDPQTGAVTGFGEMVVRYAMPENDRDAAALVIQGQQQQQAGERCEDQEPYCDHCEVG